MVSIILGSTEEILDVVLLAVLGFLRVFLLFPCLLFLGFFSLLPFLAIFAFFLLFIALFTGCLSLIIGTFRLILFLVFSIFLLFLTPLFLLKRLLLVLLALLGHSSRSRIGHILEQSSLFLCGLLFLRFCDDKIFLLTVISFSFLSFLTLLLLHDDGLLTLETFLHVDEGLVITFVLDLENFFDNLRLDFFATELGLGNLEGDVGNDQSDHNLKCDDNMLYQNSTESDVSARPENLVLLMEVLGHHRFFQG